MCDPLLNEKVEDITEVHCNRSGRNEKWTFCCRINWNPFPLCSVKAFFYPSLRIEETQGSSHHGLQNDQVVISHNKKNLGKSDQ